MDRSHLRAGLRAGARAAAPHAWRQSKFHRDAALCGTCHAGVVEPGERVLLLLHERESKRYAQQPAADFGDLQAILRWHDVASAR